MKNACHDPLETRLFAFVKNGRNLILTFQKQSTKMANFPMQVTDNMEDVPMSKLYPPPQLHCEILGPLNDTMRKLEQIFPVEMVQFKKNWHIKGSGPMAQH